MNHSFNVLDILACIDCGSNLSKKDGKLICSQCGCEYKIENDIVLVDSDYGKNTKLSQNKWEKWYQDQLKNETYKKEFVDNYRMFYEFGYKQFLESKKLTKNDIFLEIGCGQFYHSLVLADKCKLVVGIDFSPSALKIAQKMMESKGITNYLLIQAELSKLPLKNNSVDFIYGGGVLEHFDNTPDCLRELNRVLKRNGISFNTVPIVNLASLTYRQIWGNIPDIPMVREIFKFVHIRLLKARHMVFGYERSFWIPSLKKLHQQAGFTKTKVKRYKTDLRFAFIPKFLRPVCIYLSEHSILFWPMAIFEARK
jgi:ubiquinone/menaquinone biosynthesis C-methylase UbiE/uncharacterized protein YbaR (Trm112 family)